MADVHHRRGHRTSSRSRGVRAVLRLHHGRRAGHPSLLGPNNIEQGMRLADYLALPDESRHLHIFHGIGHSPNVEIPQRFAGLLTRFVEEVTEARELAARVLGA